MRRSRIAAVLGWVVLAIACGGGDGSSRSSGGTNTLQNVLPIIVNPGPDNNYVNGAFATVTVCAPGTSNCQAISGVLVDTGSSGLRVLQSALTVPLPQQTVNGNPVAECHQFQDGFTWGSVRIADVKLAGEQASSIPVQLIGDPAFATVPSGCTNTGLKAENTLHDLGANGILGVGPFRQDCGGACVASAAHNVYFTCPASGCVASVMPLALQVQNPVWMFPQDNNGVLVQLPSLTATGGSNVSGSLVFGIGTQTNNALGNAMVFTIDANGNFTTTFNGTGYRRSFIDSGSNALFFPNTMNIPTCTDAGRFGAGIVDFYCPSSTLNLSAINTGLNNVTTSVSFSVANTQTLLSNNTAATAFNNLAGPNPMSSFDWGLPFFYGRNVFTAIEGQTTPAAVGPYFAF